MEKLYVIFAAVVAVLVIRLPARILGERLHAAGIRDQSKWKCDLGAAIYTHSFRLTIAIIGLLTILLPDLIFGVNILDM